MRAIIEIEGKQYAVEQGRYLEVDQLPNEPDKSFDIDKVVFVDTGSQIHVGQPYVEGAKITAKVLRHYRGPKVLVYKMRCKKGYRRKNGHRQNHTQLMIEAVNVG
jgi:large subunit ribosomal protein L21